MSIVEDNLGQSKARLVVFWWSRDAHIFPAVVPLVGPESHVDTG